MKMPLDPQLSAELQELYLENKEWLSDILFLEDEMRFFQNLFDTLISKRVKKNHNQQVEVIITSLNGILVRRKHLKATLNARKKNLEQLLEGTMKHIGLELIEEDSAIVAEIKSLLATDKLVKNELFALIEELKAKERPIALPAFLKVKRYPIL
ncbi:hypothetical protein [Pedobacter sp. SL55]|uniref:hypothetical protein n=1 Tax=Pedobacter sp. SL55 TaxID=2995161 RepID=UPI00226D6E18|nr:hypothetical protein [Pedobacter sp. SL55]WAC39410.1 hypothetical protein OVA16_12450 [Pedobacter sp. SL55]